jgi:hypothetical protein
VTAKPPLYARVLRLRYIRPGGLLCFLFCEGAIAVGILLALAELAPWWSALVLPLVVAVMVKVNDTVAEWSARARPVPAHTRTGTARRVAVPRARPADTPPPSSKVRASGRASAPGALAPSELPGFGSGAGSLGAGPPVTGSIYRHTADGLDTARRQPPGNETTGEHRRGLNQGRFE